MKTYNLKYKIHCFCGTVKCADLSCLVAHICLEDFEGHVYCSSILINSSELLLPSALAFGMIAYDS